MRETPQEGDGKPPMRDLPEARKAWSVERLQLDHLAIHWREALDAASDSLEELGRSRRALQVPVPELHDLLIDLEHERGEIELGLERLARSEHIELHRHLSGPRASGMLLGLGASVRACAFDLDGVLTASAPLHAAAWQETFDELLARHHEKAGQRFGPWRPFARREDYLLHIHGRPRLDGVHGFLASRGIRLPDGSPGDSPGAETAWGLANRKNQVLRRRLRDEPVRGFEGSIRFLELAHEAELSCAVISASANTHAILERAGLSPFVDVVIDGNLIGSGGLRPKPAPDSVLAACHRLGVAPELVAAFETTPAGIVAARVAGICHIFAVNREGGTQELTAWGADRVVSDLEDLIEVSLR
jgi:beta-phosphoglucomutase-like phosphatase (HAD superfamily)